MKNGNGKPKQGKRWFQRKVRELAEALKRLPADRREAFEQDARKQVQ